VRQMNESLTLARHVAKINYDAIPESVMAITKKSFLDQLGVILAAGSHGEGCRQFVDLAIAGGGKKESTIIGFGAKVPSYMAAFASGSMSHALDYEDVHDGGGVHPNGPLVPAALAVAESVGNISGKEFLTALTLGTDIVCRLSLAKISNEDALKAGWYMPPIYGAFGAAAAAGRLLGLDTRQILDAFSLTLCQATCSAELINSPDSFIRAIRDAFAAKTGVLSALLAQKGISGFDQPIEGKAGFYALYMGGNFNTHILTDRLGKNFEGANVSFKPWPACRGTHPYIEAALQIAKNNTIEADNIEEIVVQVSEEPISRMLWEPIARKRNPSKAIDAKFSVPFTVAAAFVYGAVSLDHFLPQRLQDGKILKVARKIRCHVIPAWGKKVIQGLVKVKYKNKVIESRAIDHLSGSPGNPMSQEAITAKFIDCAAHAVKPLPQKKLNALIDQVFHMEDVTNMREIAKYL
jgi:2-methylcitrate dehydratase PrpD